MENCSESNKTQKCTDCDSDAMKHNKKCAKCSTRTCVDCGKKYIAMYQGKVDVCTQCRTKNCLLCDNEFQQTANEKHFCYHCKYRPCIYCSKPCPMLQLIEGAIKQKVGDAVCGSCFQFHRFQKHHMLETMTRQEMIKFVYHLFEGNIKMPERQSCPHDSETYVLNRLPKELVQFAMSETQNMLNRMLKQYNDFSQEKLEKESQDKMSKMQEKGEKKDGNDIEKEGKQDSEEMFHTINMSGINFQKNQRDQKQKYDEYFDKNQGEYRDNYYGKNAPYSNNQKLNHKQFNGRRQWQKYQGYTNFIVNKPLRPENNQQMKSKKHPELENPENPENPKDIDNWRNRKTEEEKDKHIISLDAMYPLD